MGFGKVVLGAILVAAGLVLLASFTGHFPPEVATGMFRYWPVLLVAFGLAFLGNALKNALLAWLAALLVLGGAAFGIYWFTQHRPQAEPRFATTVGLDNPRVESLTLRARTFAGKLEVRAAPPRARRGVDLSVWHVSGRSDAAPRYRAAGKAGVLEWPAESGWSRVAPIGAAVRFLIPETLPVRVVGHSLFSSGRFDLTRLRADRVELEAIASSAEIWAADRGRPRRIAIRGFLSTARIRIPGDCPARVSFTSPLTARTMPDDFTEHAPGRGHGVVYTTQGRGAPIRIDVDGPFLRVIVEREPLKAI